MDESAFKSKGGIRRVANATRYSMQGFAHALRHEAAFRQELGLAVVLVPLALWLARSPLEALLMIAPMALVLIVELLNSALEALADELSLERRERLGRAKDLGSAAVFIALALVVACWAFVLVPRLL